ncbi:MAG: carboxyl transferase domain-containing protein [Bacillota bacterium]|nr:carboxyl transferase domain-containing protein [Bacillota bacterium]
MEFDELLGELKEKKERALQMGGANKVKRRHDAGWLTARERIDRLLDPSSFFEMGMLAHSDMPGMEEKTPADSLIMGYGRIKGRLVAVIVNDFTVLASTNARVNLKKMIQFKAQVKEQYHIPLIWLGEAGGARMPDCQGSKEVCTLGGGGVATLMMEYTNFREQPYIFAAMGECYGVADFQACIADFVVQVKGSAISISGPRALSRAIGQTDTGEEMGGWEVHSKVTGMTDQVAEDEEDCFRIIKEYLDYMPNNNGELPAAQEVPPGSEEKMEKILSFLPERRTRTYDMHRLIECMVDGGKMFEIKPAFGSMLITCLARVNGEVVGFIANNPIVKVGAMDTDALEKLTSFLCLCDSYNIPLIFLHDTPGHLVGKDAEVNRVGSRVVNALQALFQVTVPKISIVIRKSYGQAGANMCGPGTGADFSAAWPMAEIGFMDPLIAADVVFGELPQEERMKLVDRMLGDQSPYPAAGDYYVQDVIDPRETRKYIMNILGVVRDSKDKGIGKHYLRNWPTKF